MSERNIKKVIKTRTMDFVASLYENYLVQSTKSCPYFSEGMENFGILLKGKSLEQLPQYDKEFENCFLVNNFDKEMSAIDYCLTGKKCVHFVNRVETAYLQPENYRKLNVSDVQLPKVSSIGDKRLQRGIKHYQSLGLKTHFLPKQLLEFNKRDFGKEYMRKYPNTGIIAIIYALEILKPKTLWLVGLDFYQSDYLFRRSHQSPLKVQQEKMGRINLVEVTANIFSRYPDTQINMVSYYDGFDEISNVKIIRS